MVVQLDICGEIHGVPHHQRCLVVAYDLHSNWPEVIPMGMVITRAMVDILDMLFACWGLPQDVTPDNGPQFTLAEFPSFVVGCELQLQLRHKSRTLLLLLQIYIRRYQNC